MNFGIFLENYHKIVGTAITRTSHHVQATDLKTIINRKTLKTKYKLKNATFIANILYNQLPF